jgi:hypothetical protein
MYREFNSCRYTFNRAGLRSVKGIDFSLQVVAGQETFNNHIIEKVQKWMKENDPGFNVNVSNELQVRRGKVVKHYTLSGCYTLSKRLTGAKEGINLMSFKRHIFDSLMILALELAEYCNPTDIDVRVGQQQYKVNLIITPTAELLRA